MKPLGLFVFACAAGAAIGVTAVLGLAAAAGGRLLDYLFGGNA